MSVHGTLAQGSRVAVSGLGVMGSPMAVNLAHDGFEVTGYLAHLARARYLDHVGLEYTPSGASAASLAWLPRSER